MGDIKRRDFLTGMAALGAGALLPGCASTDGGAAQNLIASTCITILCHPDFQRR